MANPEPLVRFAAVRKSFADGVPVLRDLSLDVRRGELLTLLGPSGSGKTTALMMLAGFEAPSGGRILLDGSDLAGVAPHRRGLGIVFRNYALFAHLTVAENVGFPLELRGLGRAERETRVGRALDLVRFPGGFDRMPAQLSGGQSQRVMLARALVGDPALVLLDEPLGGLDNQAREELQAEIRALQQRLGVPMLYVTHDQSEALTLSDRIAVLHRGVVQQVAPPRVLYEQPANVFVARFVGENNLLPGEVLAIEDGMATVRLAGGAVTEARQRNAGDPGSPCMVSVRPERIGVVATAPDGLGERALGARLTGLLYLGDHVRLLLALPDGTIFTANRPVAMGMAGLTPGADVAVAWEADQATAFAPDT